MASQDFQTANVLDGVHLSVLKIMAVTKSGVTDVDIWQPAGAHIWISWCNYSLVLTPAELTQGKDNRQVNCI